MGQEQGENEGRGRRVIGLVLLLIALIAIGAMIVMFLGKPAGTSGLPPVDIPTSAAGPQSTLPSPPVAPTVLGADVVAVYDVPVSWADNSDNEDGFNIYRQRTDVAGDQVKAGSSEANTTTFLDKDTYCGETYHYTVSSFNAAGESPATVCWEITLPPCPKEETLDLQPGPTRGYNFLTGGVSANSDFYLPPAGQPRSFMADQAGQGGVIDLGITGDTPLHHVTLPQPPDYQRGGVPAVADHTYAALATDKQSVIVFKVTKLGDDAVFSYIVWRPEKVINGQCSGQTTVATPSQPGGKCACNQDGTLVCTNGVTIPKYPRCTGGRPQCDCETINFGSKSIGILVCTYPDGHKTADEAPNICEQRDCACEIGSDNQATGNWICKQSNGTVTTVAAPALCPKRRCDCAKDANGGNTGDVTCKYSDGHTETLPALIGVCPKTERTCADVPGAQCGAPGLACPNSTDVCTNCKCVPQNNCANNPGATCTNPGGACTTSAGTGVCNADCRCEPPPQCGCEKDAAGNNTGNYVCPGKPPENNPNRCPLPERTCFCYTNPTTGAWDGQKICTDGTILPGPFGDCAPPVCGNGSVESPPEECDGAGSNCTTSAGAPGVCTDSCTCRPRSNQPLCGNGVVESGEQCEPPGSQCPSTAASLVCNTKCQCVVKR